MEAKPAAQRSRRRNPFKLRDFRGVAPAHVEKLAELGIKNADQLLEAGQTRQQRSSLAKASGIPAAAILEMVKLADLARLPGVKGIRARLYFDAGIDSVAKLARWEPEALRKKVTAYVERTGFDGIPPLPKEVSSTVANARKLPRVIET
jgi:hypothetical protein